MKCSENCIDPISSKCVEYQIDEKIIKKLSSLSEDVDKIKKLFEKTIDGKTLGTGGSLIDAVQKLINNAIDFKVTVADTQNLNIDLQDIGYSSNTVINQDQLNKLFVSEIANLKNKISSVSTINNY